MLAIAPQQDDTCLAPWTEDREAKAILASFATRPIHQTNHVNVFVIGRDEWDSYEGERVEKLSAIRNRHLLAIDAAAAAHNCPALYDAFAAEPTVQQAVEAACAKANPLRLVGEA